MYIGKLNTRASGLKGSYTFQCRGTSKPLLPNKNADAVIKNQIEFESEVFSGENPSTIGWTWASLMDIGLDIIINLTKVCYVGSIVIGLEKGSAVQGVQVYDDANKKIIGRYDAETNGYIEDELVIPVGYYTDRLLVRLNACLKDIVISKFDIIGGIPEQPIVYPSPASAEYSEGKLSLESIESIVICDESDDLIFASMYLKERLAERFDVDIPVSKMNGKAITLEISEDIKSEGYKIDIDDEGVKLKASKKLGLLYAIETLVQLCNGKVLIHCKIEDYPYKPIRGFHFGLPPREELEFTKRLIRYVLIPMRYNILIIEFAGGMRFDKHPMIGEAWVEGNRAAKAGKQPAFPHGSMVSGGELLEKDEVRDLIDYARSFGLEIIPEIQSFGHVQYITYAYPEIAEVAETAEDKRLDTRSADQPPSAFYDHSYCPSNEKSYEIIYDIIDEIIEVVKPERFVHMGHDEIYQVGICPVCKHIDPAELYAKHVNRMYEYLKKKNLKMMIWADMLQPVTNYKTPPAISRIPNDIVLLDFIWYFHFDLDLEDNLLSYGFPVVMGNMYSSHYPRYESRIAKEGILGGQVSTWCRFDEYTLAKKGKIFDVIYSAEMLWNERYNSAAREVYTEIIQSRIPQIRDELRGIAKPEGTSIESVCIPLPKTPDPSLPEPLQAIVQIGDKNIGRYSFDLRSAQRIKNTPIEAEVQSKYKKIIFLHTTTNNAPRFAWEPLIKIGEYIITYTDNTEVIIPIEYAGNICVWTRRYAQPLLHQYYRHQGYIATYLSDPLIQTKTEDGRDITVLGYEWVNPYPELEIKSITCRSNGDTDADIILFGISGVR
ncbi:MAG: family 20 glycosylhydrolase [Clostridiales bacterium]|nr:family 20 glycosylhydrolase [Clostridiales bacterium]